MHDVVYHLVVIVVAAVGVVRGYRKGFTGLLSSAIGLAFGIVCARLFGPPVEEMLTETFPEKGASFGGKFYFSILASGGIFCIVCLIMQSLMRMLDIVVSLFSSGLLNSLMGAGLCILKYMMFISVAYNIMADNDPRESNLLKYANYHDGNVVESVMKLAPAVLGVPGIDELSHIVQLEDAKKIS